MIQWKQDYSSIGIVALISWTLLCFHTHLFLCTLPLWIFYVDIKPLDDSTKLLEQELEKIDIQKYQLQQKAILIFIVWNLFIYTVGMQTLVWSIGMLILSWQSQLFQVIRLFCHKVKLILYHAKSTNKPVQCPFDLDRCYHFRVIEHQRWWLHKGWIPLLLPNERPIWSDEFLIQVPSVDQFKLPPAITKYNPKTGTNQKMVWEWTTLDWQFDRQLNTDKDGWEYGGWNWESWGSQSKGLAKLTRRRHWIRNARLIITKDTTQPINIKRSDSVMTSSTASSFEDDDVLCTTPTSIHQHSFSAKSMTETSSLDNSSIDHHFWLRR